MKSRLLTQSVKTFHQTLDKDFKQEYDLRDWESNLCSNEHYSSSSENKAWKKINSPLHELI